MRDAQRFFALPWSIYSLNAGASSGYQISAAEDIDAVDRNFKLADVQPWDTLAHCT
jgi:hypothetical protein